MGAACLPMNIAHFPAKFLPPVAKPIQDGTLLEIAPITDAADVSALRVRLA